MAKAFDKVWHDGLLYKLIQSGVNPAPTKLVRSYLQERNFCVKIHKQRSQARMAEAGVPQGSLLSPILFNIFTSDIPKSLRTDLALYADDTAIAAKSLAPQLITRRLQEAADQLENWFRR